MKADIDTWYVLADGTHADPADVITNDKGVMQHKNGVPVALRENGLPLTSGVATATNAKAAAAGKPAKFPKAPADAAESKQAAPITEKALAPEKGDDQPYKTREAKPE